MTNLDYYFILVEPAVPENIGAAARAIKTMGFRNIWLVNPKVEISGKAEWVAHGSLDILQNARQFRTFEEAIKPLDFVIGSTAKKRRIKQDYHSVEKISSLLADKGNTIKKVGILFGREESGLTNDELNHCDLLCFIPMATSYPSLNLGQAVMIVCATLFRTLNKNPTLESSEPADDLKFRAFISEADKMLKSVGLDKNPNIHQRMLERLTQSSKEDMNLYFSFFQAFKDTYGKN